MNFAIQGLYFTPIGDNMSLHWGTKGLYISCLVKSNILRRLSQNYGSLELQ